MGPALYHEIDPHTLVNAKVLSVSFCTRYNRNELTRHTSTQFKSKISVTTGTDRYFQDTTRLPIDDQLSKCLQIFIVINR